MIRDIAKALTKVQVSREHEQDMVFVTRTKRRETPTGDQPSKRAKLKENNLIEPEQLPSKRRRITGKGNGEEHAPSSICRAIYDQVLLDQPRVGKREVDDPMVLHQLTILFQYKEVVRAIACKEIEKTIPPPNNMFMGEAPYRRGGSSVP